MRRPIVFGVSCLLLTLCGCAWLDNLLLPKKNADGTVSPPIITTFTEPIGAIPGYGGAAVGILGLVTGLYQSIRKRQEEGKKLSVYSGVEAVRENWDQIATVADMLKQLRNSTKDLAQLDTINKELDDLRRKGVI